MLLAQDPATMNWVGPIIQLVTAGGFGALVWYLVVKHIPGIEERHRDERNEDEARWLMERGNWVSERREWREYIKSRDESQERLAREFLEAAVQIESYIKREQAARKKKDEGGSHGG